MYIGSKGIVGRSPSSSKFTLPFKKCWHDFKVSKDIYVKSFKQHAFDPILRNKTTGYFHETFLRHWSSFKVFSVAPQYSKKTNHKVFLGQKHDLGSLQTSGNII